MPVLAFTCQLVHKTAQIAAIAVDVFVCYFMRLNFALNKSEAVPIFRGAGARTAKKLLPRLATTSNLKRIAMNPTFSDLLVFTNMSVPSLLLTCLMKYQLALEL